MNEQRQQAYLNLIRSLLNCPSGAEQEILAANTQLLDANFVQVVAAVAEHFAQQREENTANWLRNLATYLTTPETPIITEEDIETYGKFILEILRTTAESNGNPQVIYPLLAANTDKLDRIFAVRTREALPQDWAMMQNNLAAAYSYRIKGDRTDNIENAIAAATAALTVYTREALPQSWAMTQNNLAAAYSDRIKGDRADNIENAIAPVAAATARQLVINYPTAKQLNPNRQATRAEVAAFVYQALVNAGRAQPIPSSYLVTVQ